MARLDTHNGSDLFLKVLFLVLGVPQTGRQRKIPEKLQYKNGPPAWKGHFSILLIAGYRTLNPCLMGKEDMLI